MDEGSTPADSSENGRLGVARDRLHAARTETLERLTGLLGEIAGIVAASEGANADDEHDPEGATIAYDRAQTDALAQQARHQLAEIDAALARVENGTYGRCAVCGERIPEARLEARPTATTHVEHAAPRR
ncbi:TraR/DksA family transcriptional regulator [Nostocoides australiense]